MNRTLRGRTYFSYVVLTLLLIFALYPIVTVVFNSVKTTADMALNPLGFPRQITPENFVQAWGFMTQVAILAEQADHHPEWSNVYSKVSIDLTTHEADGISERDFRLAGQINEILLAMGQGQ